MLNELALEVRSSKISSSEVADIRNVTTTSLPAAFSAEMELLEETTLVLLALSDFLPDSSAAAGPGVSPTNIIVFKCEHEETADIGKADENMLI